MSSNGWRGLKFLVGLAVSAGFVWILVQGLDLGAVGQSFSGLSAFFLFPALGFLAAGYGVRIVRWWCMLRVFEPTLPFNVCVWPFLTGMAVNNVLPFRAGDALRVVGFRQQLRSPAMRVLGTVVIERILDLMFLLGFFLVGLLGLPEGVFPQSFVRTVFWLSGASAAALLFLVLGVPVLERAGGAWTGRLRSVFNSWRWARSFGNHLSQLGAALGLVRSPLRMFILILLSVVAWVFEGAVYMTVAAALQADAEPLGAWFALAAGTLATLIPSSPGYVGTFDYFAAQGLAAFGASLDVAFAFAVCVHAVLWVPLTASGLLYLVLRGVKLGSVWRNRASETSSGFDD